MKKVLLIIGIVLLFAALAWAQYGVSLYGVDLYGVPHKSLGKRVVPIFLFEED